MEEIGSLLQKSDHYAVLYNDVHQDWFIIDRWHESFKTLKLENMDDTFPENHPSIKAIIPQAAFEALIKEANRLGIVAKMDYLTDVDDVELEKAKKEIEEIKKNAVELEKLKELEVKELREENMRLNTKLEIAAKEEPKTESFQLKVKAMDNFLKIVAMDSVGNNSK